MKELIKYDDARVDVWILFQSNDVDVAIPRWFLPSTHGIFVCFFAFLFCILIKFVCVRAFHETNFEIAFVLFGFVSTLTCRRFAATRTSESSQRKKSLLSDESRHVDGGDGNKKSRCGSTCERRKQVLIHYAVADACILLLRTTGNIVGTARLPRRCVVRCLIASNKFELCFERLHTRVRHANL